jgi:hypothetical protein
VVPRSPPARRLSRPRRALLALIDAAHGLRAVDPHEAFRVRFMTGSCLLGVAIAIPSGAVTVAEGDRPGAALIAAFVAAVLLQLVALRRGTSRHVLAWTLLATVACFLAADALVTRELLPEQLAWFLLLPLAASVMTGPGAGPHGPQRSSRAAVATLCGAIALGAGVIVAHDLGFTLGRPTGPTPSWAQALEFGTFMVAAYGLVWIHDLSTRQAQAELAELRQLLSMCSWCRRIRDQDEWVTPEQYLAERGDRRLSHGLCPSCLQENFPAQTPTPPPLRAR